MKALLNPTTYPQTSLDANRVSRGIQLQFTDYLPMWAILGYFGASLIPQLLWIFIQLPHLPRQTIWVFMLLGANIVSILGIFVISRYARTPIIAYDIEDIHWEDDIRAESTNTLILSTAVIPWGIPLVAENFSASAVPLALMMIYLVAVLVMVGIFYWASRQYARHMWREVSS
ncbi:hypothetical protein [Arcanobacterium buesumense]|uniref:Uncharacterized protein n=1 Tax=Arcanobacterium buesumense TaxID=2722751 RepID=A0A6H2EMA9_9ACTO|nr:hypothetical protein [Arcanobacterium buesumense]QJC22215.1 hypothetical protein HC352_06630 [Arcanobacterium buesumense]